MQKRFIYLWLLFAGTAGMAQQSPVTKHVIVIGIDGLSSDGVEKAATPHLDNLMKRGAYSLQAQAVLPTYSSPNWASMIMGAGPEQHGITSNAWQRSDGKKMTYCGGEKGETWPTIFKLVRQHVPNANIACFLDWGDFGRMVEPNVLSIQADTRGEDHTTTSAIHYLQEQKPLFTFIHLDHVDHVGHEIGHGTPAYYQAVEKADSLVGAILKGIEEADMQEETVVLVTSDHGGRGKGHGGKSKKEVHIPWIIAGPGIRKDKAITDPIVTYDTAATIAFILGITPPSCWIAKPVRMAFEEATPPISAGTSAK